VKVRSKIGRGTIFSVFFPFDGLAEKIKSDSAMAS
jgi:hypothetical protein